MEVKNPTCTTNREIVYMPPFSPPPSSSSTILAARSQASFEPSDENDQEASQPFVVTIDPPSATRPDDSSVKEEIACLRIIPSLASTLFILSIATTISFLLCREIFETKFTTCNFSPYHVLQNPDANHTAFMSTSLRNFFFYNFIHIWLGLLFLLHVVFAKPLFRSYVGLVSNIAIPASLYFPYYEIIKWLRQMITDTECSKGTPNGISGHGFYTTWVISLFIYLVHGFKKDIYLCQVYTPHLGSLLSADHTSGKFQCMQRAVWRNSKYFIYALYSSVAIVCTAQIVVSYWFGYHSFQQLFLGFILGFFLSAIGFTLLNILFPYDRASGSTGSFNGAKISRSGSNVVDPIPIIISNENVVV